MPLTNAAIRNAKPAAKVRRLYDTQGLYLEIHPAGGRWWRFKYRFGGKEKRLSLGVYPDTNLAQARERRDEARKLLAQGVDPSAARKAERHKNATTFEAVAREWVDAQRPAWSAGNAELVLARLEADVFPWIGSCPIDAVTPQALLDCIRRTEARGAGEVARRNLANASRIFRFGIASGRCTYDIAASIKEAVTAKAKRHHAALTDPRDVADLLRAIDGYQGAFVTRCALRLTPLLFVRPGELRHAEWSEIDLDRAEWRIPAAKMKARQMHIVPLARQAMEILHELRPLTGGGKYLFPSVRSNDRPMSENTITAALRRLGYSGEQQTAHGFRSTASTILNEHGWNRDAVERQLAHAPRDKVRAAYNYAEYLPERRRMVQWWADYLDALRTGGQTPARDP